MNNELTVLKQFSAIFGHSIEYSQGGGTNASAKVGDIMIIKASGYTLADMIEKKGYVLLSHRPIAHLYTGAVSVGEDESRAVIRQALSKDSLLQPSIETGFHSFLHKYVLHLHPLYLNALLCLKNCAPILEELYRDSPYALVDYKRPGHHLSAEVARQIGNSIFFLKNHGLIVSGNDADAVIETAQAICAKAKQWVIGQTGLAPYVYTAIPAEPIHKRQFLFPDAVVYLHDLKPGQSRPRNVNEALFAHNALLEMTEKLGERQALSDNDVQELIEMEEERYRKTVL